MDKLIEIEISRMANNGKGVGTAPDGKTVFVNGAVPGDRLLAERITERPRFYEAEIREILVPSPDRIAADCPETDRCGGCCFRQMTCEAELKAKTGFVCDAFRRIGGFEVLPSEPIIPSPLMEFYRNKAEFAIGTDRDGKLTAGFYSEKTHRVVPVPNCRIVPKEFLKITEAFTDILKLRPGLIHHLVLRRSGLTGEIMLIIASAEKDFRGAAEAAEKIRELFPQVVSVILNTCREENSPVTGAKTRVLSGAPFIRDQICGVPVEIGPLSFFQVNTPAAELLYKTAAEFADVGPDDVVLDLYCGMGTIGLAIAPGCRQLIGGEIIPEAVESARRNAAAMGLTNTRFLCGDAGKIAGILIREKIRPSLIILDPPRKGCSQETLEAVLSLNPDRIVMVSCDPATAARDCRVLCDRGYPLTRLRPVDLFPGTKHVETCMLLSKRRTASL